MEASLRGDLRWATIAALLQARAEESSDQTAIVDTDRTLTYGELHREARRLARGLVSVGIERHDRVAIWAPNQWRWVVAALGAHACGATLVPINTRYKAVEASYILEVTRPKVLVTADTFLGVDYPALLAGSGPPPGCLSVVIGDVPRGGITYDELLAKAGRIDDDVLSAREASVLPDDPSDILFTSGTTGHPKGVVTDHSQNLHAYYDWSTLAGMRRGDRYAIIPPFFHAFGYKVGWLSSLMHGITMWPHAVLDVPVLLRQIERARITIVPGPPALLSALLDHPLAATTDMSSLRVAIIGAATIPPVLVRRMKDELGFERITTCYGLTEATGVVTISRAEDPLGAVATTAGRAVPDVDVGIVPRGTASPSRTGEGEIVVRGYNIMRGYLATTEEVPSPVDGDGWLHTGDIGVIDDLGYLRITDRMKDMFVVGGFNVSPAEVEKALLEHPDVDQVAVIGVPDDRLGEVGMAFVTLRAGSALSGAGLLEWCRPRLANFKTPRFVEVVGDLPRNATGKVLKEELRRRAGSRLEAGGPRL